MSLILDGTNGVSDIDGTAATPAIRGTDANTGIFFPAADTIAFSEGGTEAMRINGSGFLGIGTTNPLTPVHAVGAIQSQRSGASQYARIINSAGTATFISDNQASGAYTGFEFQGLSTASATPVTYASINGSGNLLVGTTDASAKFVTQDGANIPTGRFYSTLSTYTSEALQVICAKPSNTNFNVAAFYINNATQYAAYIRGDGTIFAQNTTVQSASDLRFKENIVDSNDGLNVITELRPVRFDIKEGNGVTAKTNQLGFIAQEVQKIMPDLVKQGEYLGLDKEAIFTTLVKAIQELKQEIDNLKS
jgi:hypothetical protein